MSIAPRAPVHGYHFHVRFVPKWREVAPILVRRARAVGLEVPDDGAGLEPRANSLAFVGTRWAKYKYGGLRFDVLEERRELKGEIVSAAGNAGEHPTYAFGLARPGVLPRNTYNELTLEIAAGLWLREGSLTLRPWEGLAEEVIAEFQLWTALEALAKEAQGEPALGRPSAGTALVSKHVSSLWAPSFEASVARREAEARARFASPTMNVDVQVNLIAE